jgi:hypothetical protein
MAGRKPVACVSVVTGSVPAAPARVEVADRWARLGPRQPQPGTDPGEDHLRSGSPSVTPTHQFKLIRIGRRMEMPPTGLEPSDDFPVNDRFLPPAPGRGEHRGAPRAHVALAGAREAEAAQRPPACCY